MRHKKLILFCLMLIFLPLMACQRRQADSAAKGLRIVTSFYPIYAMVKEVSGDLNDVRMIQSRSGIHGFEPSVNDVQAIYDADAFIYHSHILESWAGRLDPNLKHSKVKVLEASKGMDLQRVPGLEDMKVADGIDPATLYDPHTWVDPLMVAQELGNIAELLTDLDPEHADIYRENSAKEIKKAEQLHQKFAQLFSKVKSKTFVTQHTAFSYVANRYGLTQLGIANVSNQEPSPRQLAEIKDFIEEYKVKTIFVERGMTDKTAKALTSSTGVELKKMDPLEADPENNLSYLENLEANLQILADELK